MEVKVICQRCDQPITHECNADIKESLTALMSWVPSPAWASQQIAEAFERESKDQGDEHDFKEGEFFGSQAWSYLIFHKEDARTFHALLHNLMRALGVDPYEFKMQLHRAKEAEKAERDARMKLASERRAARAAAEKKT